MITYIGYALLISLGYLVSMNTLAKTTFLRWFVVSFFSFLSLALTYQVLGHFGYLSGYLSGTVKMILWFFVPVHLYLFWNIKDFATNLADLDLRKVPVKYSKTVKKTTQKNDWVQTGV